MSNTYQVAEVSVTLPAIGTVSRDDYGNVVKRGAKCRVHLYAVHPDWRDQGSVFDGFLVGSVLTCGYTDMPTHHTRRILMPDGYKLVALSVDEDGMPKSWDSLPVCFVGGYTESPDLSLDEIADLPRFKIGSDFAIQQKIADALDIAKTRYYETFGNTDPKKTAVVFLANRWVAIEGSYTPEEISAALEHIQCVRAAEAFSKAAKKVSPFAIKDGEVFIQDAFIGNGVPWSMKVHTDEAGRRYAAGVGIAVNNKATKIRLSDDMREAVIDAVRESDLFKALQTSLDAQASAQVTTQPAIEQAATDAILNALKTGGLLYRGI